MRWKWPVSLWSLLFVGSQSFCQFSFLFVWLLCSLLIVEHFYRIAGGIGAVLPWIPIKAYRPCPNFINRGGFYERAGQGLDEIAFGRDSSFPK
jgi:hypothetical protein